MPKFIVPGTSIEFEIPDDWWQFCDMEDFRPATTFYLYSQRDLGVQTVPIAEVKPPVRKPFHWIPQKQDGTDPACFHV
jgi:hypothetical protein